MAQFGKTPPAELVRKLIAFEEEVLGKRDSIALLEGVLQNLPTDDEAKTIRVSSFPPPPPPFIHRPRRPLELTALGPSRRRTTGRWRGWAPARHGSLRCWRCLAWRRSCECSV